MVSIIIPTKGNSKMLIELIDSIFQSNYQNFEIILITNKDNIKLNNVKVIVNKNFRGYSHALNLGAKSAKREFYFFINDDMLFSKNSLKNLFEASQKNGKKNIYAPMLLNTDGSLQDSVFLSFFSKTIFDFFHNRILNFCIKILNLFLCVINLKLTMWGLANKNPRSSKNYKHAMGAAIFVHKTIYKKVGGFDEKIYLTLEDQLFCKNVFKLGSRVKFVEDSKIIHYGNQTISHLKNFDDIFKDSVDYFRNFK
jgi:GT2 family glycosyltransferase